jgi:hypothetical protein
LGRLCDELTAADKQVYASSLNLVTEQEQYRAFKDIAERLQRIEINSPAFLALARRYPAVTGVFLNVCNSVAADILAGQMVRKVVLPCELSFSSISSIAKKAKVATEIVVHGHIPIAISGTCYTARLLGPNGDGCGKRCRDYPEGMVLEASGQPLFCLDGPQTLSAMTYCLVEYLPELEKAGIDTVRILPQWNHTARIVCIYKDVLEHRKHRRDALEELRAISPMGLCNGYFIGKAGWICESPNVPPAARVKTPSPSFVPSERRLEKESEHRLYDTADAASENLLRTWFSNDIPRELNQLVEMMNRDPRFIERIAGLKRTKLVLDATDTARAFIIELDNRGVRIRPYAGEDFDVKISAAEEVLWAVLSGQMDADAAFFAGKVHICGSVATAFRVKNKFLGLLQKHLANISRANTRLAVNS